MCGICGVLNADRGAGPLAALVDRMTDDLRRRGPDDRGTWVDPQARAALGFRRLSVIDPSPGGAQPMWSGDGRHVLVFNGEIYNHAEIGRELESTGSRFRSTSDTEVLVEGLARWGVDLLPRLRGMFAFAWHRPDRGTTVLARDHAGIKPLFLARPGSGPTVAFSSRYDSLFRTGWLDVDDLDPGALAAYLELKAVPAPGALHRGAAQVAPGHLVEVGPDGPGTPVRWWSLPELDGSGLRGAEAVDALGEVIERSVARHLVSDVPLGVFLSAGVDSPLVAGTAARLTSEPPDAFTISHPAWGLDEGPEARRIGERLGLTPTLREVHGPPADVLERVAEAQDEPVNDWSIVPTLLVSELARGSVTVALSGDGGDEVFLGYERPRALVADAGWWRLPRWARRVGVGVDRRLGLARVNEAVAHRDPGAYYRMVHASAPLDVLRRIAPDLGGMLPSGDRYAQRATTDRAALASFARRMEFTTQLQRVLRKVDMASMHHSLEVRVPLLDVDVITAASAIDPAWSLGAEQHKPVLRALLARMGVTPPAPKVGFGVPMAEWMSGPLREPLTALFAAGPQPDGWIDATAVRACWRDQLAGHADHRRPLWAVAVLDLWMRRTRGMVP